MATANLSRLLRFQVVRRGAKEALVDGERRWSYRELDALVDRTAGVLLETGVKPGELVAVLARNSAEVIVEMFALARAGAVFLPLNWRLHERELGYVVGHAGVSALIVDEEFHAQAAALAAEGSVRTVYTHAPSAPPGWHALGALVAAAPATRVPDAEVGLDDLHRILYTSGTTSHPKGVVHTFGNLIWNQLGQLLELELTAADRTMVSAPLFHVSGLEVPGHATLYAGGTLVLTGSYAGRDVVSLTACERVTGLVLAAQIVYDILALPDLDQFDLSPLRFVVFGGVPPSERRRFQDALPHVRLVDTFGMTEITNGACYMDAAHARAKLGAQGTPFPHLDVRVVDAEGRELPPGEVGEIVVRGPKVSPGYWRDPEATAAAWRDGWFHTGDMASLDEDGYLWFADRKKDMIRSGGENVASAEIERVLAAHPGVAEVAVVGVPDPKWDEVPKAFVILRPGVAVTAEELVEHCRGHLARFKVPKQLELVDHLPRNDSGKVLKRLLRDEAQEAAAAALDARRG